MKYEIKRAREDRTQVVAEVSGEGAPKQLLFLSQIESGGFKWLAFDDGPFPASYVLNRHSDASFSNATNAIQWLKDKGYRVDMLPKGTTITLEITL